MPVILEALRANRIHYVYGHYRSVALPSRVTANDPLDSRLRGNDEAKGRG